jgi:stalled ribosome rescue protein Dom34
MTTLKKLGIWMDHANAHLMEFTAVGGEEKVADSALTQQAKEQTVGSSENVIHNKEQQQQTEYYKKLGDAIRNFDEVVLFGPTNAKAELLNTLRADHRFEKIKIDVQQADKMTDNQQQAFVKDYFSKIPKSDN